AARELGVSTPALSQAVRKLEQRVGVALLTRTTRRVALTDAGRRLADEAGPALDRALEAVTRVASGGNAVGGRLRISIPPLAIPALVAPLIPRFARSYPDVELEFHVDNRRVDLIGEGFDAGVRFEEFVEKDMVQLRLTRPCRFVVVGSPEYLEKRGVPKKPSDLHRHDCLEYRSPNTGRLYRWELERGHKRYRVAVRGKLVSNDERVLLELARAGMGLCYAFEPQIAPQLEQGNLRVVLEPYAAAMPGLFLFFPNRSQVSPALRAFIDLVRTQLKEL
ncbi:MAG TPA: LysR substrate-binding domain-containing protein, partial [Polyangiaceae bacterium]|nr:LysR substrate-binding domain-containing protein [Polyangiaceae bacterium]